MQKESGWFKENHENTRDLAEEASLAHGRELSELKETKKELIEKFPDTILWQIEKVNEKLMSPISTSPEKIDDTLEYWKHELEKSLRDFVYELEQYALLYPPFQSSVLRFVHFSNQLMEIVKHLVQGKATAYIREWERSVSDIEDEFDEIRLGLLNTNPVIPPITKN